jgi:hypothetical protein
VDEGLRAFAAARTDVMRPSFDAAMSVARLEVPPRLIEQMRRIQGDPAASRLFAAVAAGAVASASADRVMARRRAEAAAIPPAHMPQPRYAEN